MYFLVLGFPDKNQLIYFEIQGTATIIPEETTEEKESNLMENHANSTENSEDLKRQIAELKNVSELHYTSMNCCVIYWNMQAK